MTTARWYGGHAAVPSERSFSSRKRMRLVGIEHRLRLLEQVALVRRAAALGHEEELVRVAAGRVELDLRGQVVAGVALVPHGERRHLRVAQVRCEVRVEHAARDRDLVVAVVTICWPFLPMTIAVPVSWHMGRTPPAAMQAFLSRSSATKRSLADASGSSRILRSCCRCAGRRKWAMSCIASDVRRVRTLPSTSTNRRPPASNVETPSLVMRRYSVSSGPSGSMSW